MLSFPGETKVDYKNLSLTPESYMFTQGRLIQVTQKDIKFLELYTRPQANYGIVVGSTLSDAETLLTKALNEKRSFSILDFEKINAYLKEKLGGEDGPLDEVPFDKLLAHLRSVIASSSGTQLISNWPVTLPQLKSLVAEVGEPLFVLNLNVSRENLVLNYRKKGEMDKEAELTEEDNEKINTVLISNEASRAHFQEEASKSFYTSSYNLDCNEKPEKFLPAILNLFQLRVVACNITFENNRNFYYNILANICTSRNIIFMDVHQLIDNELSSNGPLAEKLRSEYVMRRTSLPQNFPSNYSSALVISLI